MPAARRFLHLAVPVLILCCSAALGADPTPTLTVEDAVQIALANNMALNAAARDVTQANDQAASARADLLPVIRVKADADALLGRLDVRVPAGSLGVVNQAPFPTTDARVLSAPGAFGVVGATVAQPLTQLPVIRLNIRLRQVGTQVAQEQQRARRLAVAAAVTQTFYQILQTQDGITAAQSGLISDQELERTVQDFVRRQTALQADLLDAQALAARQELAVSDLRDTLADAKERLNALLGRDVATPFEVSLPALNPLPLDDAPVLVARALRQRPELKAARLRVEQATLGRRIAQEPNLPAVSLALSYHQLAGRVDGLPNSVSTLGLQLDWAPIDWGRRQHARDEQAQQSAQAQEALQDAQSQVTLDVNTKIRQFRAATARLSVAQAGQRAAQERLREMTNQFEDRTILLKDLLRQQAAAADADGQEGQAVVGVLAARTALEIAVGDGE